ncbi:MAG: dienelactone hydrolase family protein [Patescibacteria group bacterium]
MNKYEEINQIVNIPVDSIFLEGILNIPKDATGIVIFVHGSGSSRLSPRNYLVAKYLQENGFATLLFDLLTEEEDRLYENRFDIDLISERLKIVTEWVVKQKNTSALKIGYFGASTGSAAAIKAAVDLENKISAIVSRGGRPDLAATEIFNLNTPTLLIVGGSDRIVIELNSMVFDKIRTDKKMEIIPGATHLFEELGTLEEVARLAVEWFKEYLV